MAVTLFILDFYLTRYTVQREVRNVETRLEAEARILTAEAAVTPLAKLQAWAQAASLRTNTRVTIVDAQGVVLGESHHDPDSMENHANRPEIREAYQNRVGSSVRHSYTLNRDLCYVAVPLVYGGQSGYVLRVALPLEDLDGGVAAVRWRILEGSLAAAVVALGIAYIFSHSLTRRIGQLRTFAEGLVNARFSQPPLTVAGDELGALARSLDTMARQLRDLLEQLTVESRQREAILASMVEGVLAVDHELRVTFCNRAFAHAVGVRLPIPEGLPVLELVRDPALLELLSRTLRTGAPVKDRLQLPVAEGHAYEVQTTPLSGPSGWGALALLHDITDLERLERVRKDFVANVSHELRTPLTAIRASAETLLDGALEDTENRRRFLDIIRAHSIRLSNITSDLLTLSEIEARKNSVEPERVPLRAALDAALHTVEAEARLRGVKVLAENLQDVEVPGERLRLEQALVNLLDNAIKFNRPGGEVRVTTARTADARVRISIADTGIGIPSAGLMRIFERFYRVDKARSREMGGTGLGLSIVKHVVERMNGTVSVESALGKGSTFTVLLPALRNSDK
jgi:two-component system, OmpR family, phosphate regulon sensor histidine kinase PhoR